ncbi:alpha/beta hydrolase [Shewanella decolorationis]|uniref:Alpha/beta hydrolase n=1 Tax=Shewanella decolorationis TaxID=256839 RepID=A0A5B8QY48_9GAMM|nr:alpha/beta hydrolase-fold protein [Shewanella decolorationis]QDZ91580.1 alpha/beta hydrolase [Shewanella decolorationis]
MRMVLGLIFFLSMQVMAQAGKMQIHSEILNDDINLQIKLPDTYGHSNDFRYPVLVVLDGSTQFEHIAANVGFLSSYAIIPELIVVGVSSNNRLKSFTPTQLEQFKDRSGGAENYRQFLETELLSSLGQKYRMADYHILSGHSMAGLFSSYVALTPDTRFNAAISISPSLWWDNNWLVQESAKLAVAKRTKPMRWFLSIASEPNEMASAFASQITQLQNTLGNSPSVKPPSTKMLQWFDKHFPEETHDSTPLIGNVEALKTLFAGWNAVPEIAVMPLKALKQFYQQQTAVFGYEFPLSAQQYNVYGLKASYEQKTAWGVEILLEGTKVFPMSEVLWDSLATAYDLDGQTALAVEASSKAVQLAKQSDSVFLNEILSQAKSLQDKTRQ